MVLLLSPSLTLMANSGTSDEVLFDIPRQRADLSLIRFAEQANLTLIVPFDQVQKIITNRLKGRHQIEQAIKILLIGTGLDGTVGENGQLSIVISQYSDVEEKEEKTEKKNKQSFFAKLTALLASSGSTPNAAIKVENAQFGSGPIEEIIVTARKRGNEVLQDIPATITALTQDTLEKMGVSDFTDFAYQIPGLTFTDLGPGEKAYIIRGIQSAGQQQVSVYYDEVPVPGVQGVTSNSGSQTTDLKIFDVNQIEVLRGPQGTTFGANAQTGTVRYILNKPKLTQIESTFKIGGNFIENGDMGGSAYAMVNLPVVDDKFGLRFVGYYDREGGYVDNVRLGKNNINWIETTGARIMAQYRPNEKITMDFMAWGQNRRNGGDSEYHPYDVFGNNPFNDTADQQGFFQTGDLVNGDYVYTGKPDEQQIYNATLSWDIGAADVTATASYYRREFDFNEDSTWFLFTIGVSDDPSISPFRADLSPAATNQRQDIEQKAFEIRVVSTNDTPLQYLGGVFYRERESNFRSFVQPVNPLTGRVMNSSTPPTGALGSGPGAGIPGCNPCVFARRNFKAIDEIAVFGELSYAITEKIEALLGLRWFEAKQKDVGQTVFQFALSPRGVIPPIFGNFKQDELIRKFQLSFQANDDLTVFALASEGFRLGGTNQQGLIGSSTAIPGGYEADKLWNYEIGLKSSWLGGRYIVNANVFYVDWDNIQVTGRTPDGLFGFIGNAGAAEVFGFEMELYGQPTDVLNFTFGLSYLPSAELKQDQISPTIVAPGMKGDQLPRIPELTLNATVQYDFNITNTWDGYFRGEFSHTGSSCTELARTNTRDRPQKSYELTNLRFSAINLKNDLELAFFIENIFDTRADVAVGVDTGEPTFRITSTPRHFGVELTKRF